MTRRISGGSTSNLLGAYGLILRGLDGAAPWMQPQEHGAPALQISVEAGHTEDHHVEIGVDHATLGLANGGVLSMRRDTETASFSFPVPPPDEDLLHPYLASAAALFWRWSGRESLHGGAFGVSGRAILVLGDKGAGKSTTLAWLAGQEVPVLTDDLCVLDGNCVVAGPRSIDLRNAPGHFVATTQVRGDRHRMQLPNTQGRLPIGGVALLEWDTDIGFEPVEFRERFAQFYRQRPFPEIAPNPRTFLDLCSVRMVRARRPKGLSSLPDFGSALLEYFS